MRCDASVCDRMYVPASAGGSVGVKPVSVQKACVHVASSLSLFLSRNKGTPFGLPTHPFIRLSLRPLKEEGCIYEAISMHLIRGRQFTGRTSLRHPCSSAYLEHQLPRPLLSITILVPRSDGCPIETSTTLCFGNTRWDRCVLSFGVSVHPLPHDAPKSAPFAWSLLSPSCLGAAGSRRGGGRCICVVDASNPSGAGQLEA